MVSCGFNLHFSNRQWYWPTFRVLICHLYVLWWNVCSSLLPIFLIGSFVFLLLSVEGSLYILNKVSFTVQKPLIWWSLTYQFYLLCIMLLVIHLKTLPNLRSLKFSQHYLLKSIIFLLNCFSTYPKFIQPYVYDSLYSIPLVCASIPSPIPHCFDYCSFIVSLKIRWYNSSNFILLLLLLLFCFFCFLSFCYFLGRSHGTWRFPS